MPKRRGTKKRTKEVQMPDKVFCFECGCPHEIDGKCVACGAPWPSED